MSITKQRTLDYMQQEWGTYVERFERLSKEEQQKRLKENGYACLRDLLAHVLVWWEEGMGVIRAIAAEREFARKQYDFDAFNAEAVARYQGWNEAEFVIHFEKERRQIGAELRSIEETVFENRRVRRWLNGIFIVHAREHLLALSRFLSLDTLQNEWAEYADKFKRLDEAKQKEFLSKQGVDSFHDLLAHILGWWEEGARIITGILDSPSFQWTEPDVDQFNVEITRKFASWSEADLMQHYEIVRQALIDLVHDLPDDAFRNKDIEDWLATDVVRHYDEHAMPT